MYKDKMYIHGIRGIPLHLASSEGWLFLDQSVEQRTWKVIIQCRLGERERERERVRDEAYGFFIDADWLFRVHVEYLLNALWILESDKSKAPAIN